MINFIISILLFTQPGISHQQNMCQPFGLRLNYGRVIYQKDHPQKLAIRFNTKLSCPQISILINNQTLINCSTQRHKYYLRNYQQTKSLYHTHIHKCSLFDQIEFNQEFYYNLINTDNKAVLLEEDIKIYLKDPTNVSQAFSFMNIADWGPITNETLREQLQQSTPHLSYHIKHHKIDAILLNGDIGYELNSDEDFHKKVMNELATIASRVPIIVNRGNHEVNEQDNNVGTMFQEYFQTYQQEINDCTSISIGDTVFILVDPYKLLIPRLYNKYTSDEMERSLINFEEMLKNNNDGKNLIVLSHYPLVCGIAAVEHCIPDPKFNEILPLYVNLKGFYDLVLKYNVPLVLSGHVHTYQRTFPMLSGYRTKPSQLHQYTQNPTTNFFIQVVEGNSGSNDGILNSTSNKQLLSKQMRSKLTAKLDIDRLGLGILHITKDQYHYEHFSIQKNHEIHLIDNFTILLLKNNKIKEQLIDL